jgi:DNA-binding XRE family transcriptional regulator
MQQLAHFGGNIMKFGEKLRSLRLQNHLTQTALAEKLGVSLRTLQNYETCKIYPKQTDIYARISALFGVSTDYLLSDRPAPDYVPTAPMPTEELIARVGSLFAGGTLSDRDKDKVFATITELYWQAKRQMDDAQKD